MSKGKIDDVVAVDKSLPLLREFEGLRLVAEREGRNGWVIGYGHSCDGPGRIDKAEAERLLVEDALLADAAVSRAVHVLLNTNQRTALICLAYNIGGEAFEESTLARRLNDGEGDAVADEFVRWVHDDGVVLSGLVQRRAAERELFLTPCAETVPVVAGESGPGWLDSLNGGALGWVKRRAVEPSTWRGLGGVLVAFGLVSAGSVEALISVGLALASAVELIRSEKVAG